MIPRLSDSFDFQAQALTLRAERQRLLAGNIANADTPGYVARDLDFAAALSAATGSAGPAGAALNGLRASLPGGTGAEPQLRWASASQSSLDGNTVDMDRERASIAAPSCAAAVPAATANSARQRKCRSGRCVRGRAQPGGRVWGWSTAAHCRYAGRAAAA